jgi:RHS repeat-associated protein
MTGGISGGVGGLALETEYGASSTNCFAAYDGNGNITTLINAADKSLAARYEYSPFHQLLRATGPLAYINQFRSSTKYWDDESGLVYYGYRYYSPSFGRWISRDPLEEKGGLNLYGFCNNSPIFRIDTDGKESQDLNDQFLELLEKLKVDDLPDFIDPIGTPAGIWAVDHFFDVEIEETEGQEGLTGILTDSIGGFLTDKIADITINPSAILTDVGQNLMGVDFSAAKFMGNAQSIVVGQLGAAVGAHELDLDMALDDDDDD